MRQNGNTLRLAAAAVIMMGGAAWAGNVYLQPVPEQGPDPEQLKALAERLRPQRDQAAEVLELDRSRPRQVAIPFPSLQPRPERRPAPGEARQVQQASSAAMPLEDPSAAPEPAESDPVKNIALMGVTDRAGVQRAWLVDLLTKDRDPFEEGQEAYGFTVGDIRRNSVVLTRDGQEFELRLGAKPIPSAYGDAPAPVTTASAPVPAPGGRQQAQRGQQRNGGRRGGGNGRRRSNRWRNNNQQRGNMGAMRNAMNAARSRGGFGGGFNQNNNWGRNQAQVSSNPQTARRRGIRLVGGAEPLPQPPAVTNPQTQRRRGNNNGNAFGAQNNGNQRNQQRRR